MKLNDQLKQSFAIWSVIAWNVLLGSAIWFNGGLGKMKNPLSLLLSALACGSAAFFAFGALVSLRIRHIVLKENTPINDVKNELLLTGSITGLLFAGCLVGSIWS